LRISIAHTEYAEQHGGLMICGYEWGYSKADQEADEQPPPATTPLEAECTFANKDARFGAAALGWRYDSTIKRWFDLWGHPLNRSMPGQFERSIFQTNWCNSMNHSMEGDYSRLLAPENAQNFASHVRHFSPSVILLMGNQLFPAIHNPSVFGEIVPIMGEPVGAPIVVQKPFDGRRFKLSFQSFSRSEVVCLPHPSSSRGLSHAYIELFTPEVGQILAAYRSRHGY
jgi:hypothetical protein